MFLIKNTMRFKHIIILNYSKVTIDLKLFIQLKPGEVVLLMGRYI